MVDTRGLGLGKSTLTKTLPVGSENSDLWSRVWCAARERSLFWGTTVVARNRDHNEVPHLHRRAQTCDSTPCHGVLPLSRHGRYRLAKSDVDIRGPDCPALGLEGTESERTREAITPFLCTNIMETPSMVMNNHQFHAIFL